MHLPFAPLVALLLLVQAAHAQGPDDGAAVARISGRAILAAQIVRVARLARAIREATRHASMVRMTAGAAGQRPLARV